MRYTFPNKKYVKKIIKHFEIKKNITRNKSLCSKMNEQNKNTKDILAGKRLGQVR